MNNFKESVKFGEEGEEIVMKYLIEKEDRECQPLFQFEPNKTPIIYSKNGKIISPDIQSYIDGRCIFVECKRKNKWVNWNGEDQTGLDYKHWKNYTNLVYSTYCELEIYFLHKDGLFRFKINHRLLKKWKNMDEDKLPYRTGYMTKKKELFMIFFYKNQLEKL